MCVGGCGSLENFKNKVETAMYRLLENISFSFLYFDFSGTERGLKVISSQTWTKSINLPKGHSIF